MEAGEKKQQQKREMGTGEEKEFRNSYSHIITTFTTLHHQYSTLQLVMVRKMDRQEPNSSDKTGGLKGEGVLT
jgi:hypothetical protein